MKSTGIVWETPKKGFIGRSGVTVAEIVAKYNLQLDVCCTPENRVTECAAFFSLKIGLDGLDQKWLLNSWMNPPYNNQQKWLIKAVSQVIDNHITVVGLLHVDTSATYFRKYAMGIDDHNDTIDLGCNVDTKFIPGRVQFWSEGSPLASGRRPEFACCFTVWTPKV